MSHTDKTLARTAGVLFIVASVAAIAGGSLVTVVEEAGYLTGSTSNTARVVSGAVIELIMVLSIVGIAVAFYPVLKRRNEALALGYLGSRTIEAMLLLAAAVVPLVLLSLQLDYGASAGGDLVTVHDTLLAGREWTYLIGSLVALGISALLLNAMLYTSRLIPRWLSVWGLIAGALILGRGLVEMYGVDLSGVAQGVLAAPIALQEMVLAVWLIVKGFSRGSPVRVSSETPLELQV